jgi:transposase
MAGLVLSSDDRVQLLRLMRRQLNSHVHRRMNVLLLLDDGWTAEAIARALYVDAETVREHRALYERSGIKGLQTLSYAGAEPALSAEQREALDAELAARLYLTAKAVCAFARQRFGVSYTPHAMAKLLGRLGYVYKKPVRVPAKADEAAQQAFLEQTLRPLMAEAGPEQPLYFVDGCHPTYTAHPACGWIKRGQVCELPSNHGRVNLNINGALSWPDRAVVHLQAEKITGETMVALFEQLEQRHPTARAISVVLDNATYNRSALIKAYLARDGCRLRLVYLPPYAPNLNLIERLWWLLQKTTLWNAYYPSFAEFKAAIVGFLDSLANRPDELRSLITDRFRLIGVSKRQIVRA